MVDWEVLDSGFAVVRAPALLVPDGAPAREDHDDDEEAREPEEQRGVLAVLHGPCMGVVSIHLGDIAWL